MRIALAAAIMVLTLVGSAGGAATKATVRPVALAPFTVHGARFHPGEVVLVRVIVRGGPRVAKSIRAGARGAFTARFASLSLTGCSSYFIRAAGGAGSTAAFTMPPPPCGAAP